MEKDNRIEIHNAQKQKRMITQDDVIKLCIQKELDELGVDLSDENYYQNDQFKNLEKEYILDGIRIPKAWWIEKNMIGQERLKRIYGIYALGVEHEFSEEELKSSVWMDDLVRKYNEAKTSKGGGGRTIKDVQQYFYRKDKAKGKGENVREELGLVERLRKLGFDIDKFKGPKVKEEQVKLLYFLFGFEYEYKVKIWSFLSQPSFENIDNSIVGDGTRNGDLMAYLKNSIMRGIDENYIAELKDALDLIIDRWEAQIYYVISVSNAAPDEELLDDIYADLQWVLGLVVEEGRTIIYEDSLLETFYLKLSLHEMIGREIELINISETEYKGEQEIDEIQRKRYQQYLPELIPVFWNGNDRYEEVTKYVKEHRKFLAQCVFGKETISNNDYRKFDKAADSIIHFLDFYKDNTKAAQANHVPVMLLISHMQEYVFGNEKIDAIFYRHKPEDKVTFRTQIDSGEALRRSQYAWIKKVRDRWYTNIGMGNINKKVQEIERCLDKLLLKVYAGNSLWEMKYGTWRLLSYIETFLGNRGVVEQRYDILIDLLESRSYDLFCSDRRIIYQCMNFLNGEQFYDFINRIEYFINHSEEGRVCTYSYDIERDVLYTENRLEGFLKIKITVKEKEIDVIDGGLRLKKFRL